MLMVIPSYMEKCKGAMVATAIGDALGWPNELRSKNRAKKPKVSDHFTEWTRSSSNPRWHDEKILPGEYSDDTQLTLSVARSMIAGGWEKFFAEKELPFWLNYERGGGGALLRAAKSYKGGLPPWQSRDARKYFNAGGNGAAMRILPHVIATAKTPDVAGLMREVVRDAIITHGHPRAILGATCYAYALDHLLRRETTLEYGELVTVVIDGQKDWGAAFNPEVFDQWLEIAQRHLDYDFSVEWENTRVNMVRQLEFIKASLKKGLLLDDTKVLTSLECFGKASGAGDVAVLSAIYLTSKYANNPTLGIKVPAFLFGADTDTIASITGGLLGMLNGMNWIPMEWKIVQDYGCLLQMTELLLADSRKDAAKAEVAEARASDDQWKVTPIGKMKVVDSKCVPNGKNGFVTIQKWKSMLGQTLYTKTFQPNEILAQPQQMNEQKRIYQQSVFCDVSSQVRSECNVPSHMPLSMAETEQEGTVDSKQVQQFVLTSTDISDLLADPEFKEKISVGKMLKIIRSLMEGERTSAAIAKQFSVSQSMVEQVGHYLVSGVQHRDF